jgi:hypothetical protein
VLERAIASALAAGGRDCQVAFSAWNGELHMEFTSDGGAGWRTSRPLP